MNIVEYRTKYGVVPGNRDHGLPAVAGNAFCCGFVSIECESIRRNIEGVNMTPERFRDYMLAVLGTVPGAVVTDIRMDVHHHKLLSKLAGNPELVGRNHGGNGNTIYVWILGKDKLSKLDFNKKKNEVSKKTVGCRKVTIRSKKLPSANKKSASYTRTVKK